jgi:hypothetical protein
MSHAATDFRLEQPASSALAPCACSAPLQLAYADPPYLGQGRKHYGKLHANADDCDTVQWHADLIARLCEQYPDGWAMSASSPSLREILPLCPADVRVAAWIKPFCAFKVNVNPAYAWEPVIWRGGRKRGREYDTARDFLSCPIAMKKGFPGAKPEQFTRWILDLLGAEKHDEIHDLFPGSGSVGEAIDRWRNEVTLFKQNAELRDRSGSGTPPQDQPSKLP